jgi:hypothetical protein
MARISKLHQYSIYWLNSQGNTVDSIADELSLETKQVSRVLEKANVINSDNSIKTTSGPVAEVSRLTSKDLMIRHTAAKKNNSVAIMTKEASEMNDNSKKTNSAHPNTDKNIFRPNG